MRSLLASLIAVALAFPAAAQSAVVNRKLSGPMVSGTVGDVGQFVISPSGERVLHEVFLRTEVFGAGEDARLEVCSSDGSGGSTVLTPYFPNIVSLLWTPDETRAVFVNQPAAFQAYELYSVPVDGSAPPRLLSSDLDSFTKVQLTGDGSRVVYIRRNAVSFPDETVDELYSVPVDGSASPRRLSAAPLRGRYVRDFLVSGSTVVYRYFTSSYHLYAAPANGSSAPITLTNSSFELDCCSEFFIDPSGTRAVILGSWVSSVPLDGSTDPVHLSSGSAVSFRVSPAGEEVVYRKSQGSSLPSQLFLVPLDGSAAPTHVADGPPANGGGQLFEFSPDGAHVVFHVHSAGSWGPVGLYSARVSDGAITTLHSAAVSSFQFSADSARVVFKSSDSRELYSVPVDGSGPAVRITPDFVPGGAVAEYAVRPDSASVLYRADAETDGLVELFEVEIAPSGAPVATRLNPPMVPGGTLDLFRMAADASYVLYRIDAEADGAVELVRSPGHDVLNAPLPTAETGDATQVAARNGRVVYLADQDVDSQFELYGAPSDGSIAPVKLSGSLVNGGDVSWTFNSPFPDFVLSADGSTVVYAADAEVDGRHEVFSTPSDGSAPPVKLNGSLTAGKRVEGYRLSPDGTRVVYSADQADFPGSRFYSIPVQGGSAVHLGPTLGSIDFEITPDSTHVLSNIAGDLYSVPIDGSAAPRKLNGTSTGLRDFAGTPDGSRVVFIASSGGVRHLFSNAIEGGSLQDLSGGLTAGSIYEFDLSVDGTRVVFLGDRLWSRPVDGSSSGVVLDNPLTPWGDGVIEAQLSPDGIQVVYRAVDVFDETLRLYRVPLDGSAPAVQLSPTLTDSPSYAIAPDGANVVVSLDLGVGSLPMTGGGFVLLSHEESDFAFAAGRRVVHVDSDGLKLTPITGGGSVTLGRAPTVEAFVVDGDRVVCLADQDHDDVIEVYSSWLDVGLTQHAPPRETHWVTR